MQTPRVSHSDSVSREYLSAEYMNFRTAIINTNTKMFSQNVSRNVWFKRSIVRRVASVVRQDREVEIDEKSYRNQANADPAYKLYYD